jgi:hypothetical protein
LKRTARYTHALAHTHARAEAHTRSLERAHTQARTHTRAQTRGQTRAHTHMRAHVSARTRTHKRARIGQPGYQTTVDTWAFFSDVRISPFRPMRTCECVRTCVGCQWLCTSRGPEGASQDTSREPLRVREQEGGSAGRSERGRDARRAGGRAGVSKGARAGGSAAVCTRRSCIAV